MADISSTIKELASRRAELQQEIAVLDEAIKSLQKISGTKVKASAAIKPRKAKRNITAAARARIVAAQKKRWAKFHAEKKAGS